MKVSPADIAFSWCVRERVNWICEYCGTEYHPPTQGLQCSHYIGRGNHSVRYCYHNAFAHCAACHFKLEGNPHIFSEWVKDKLGKVVYNKVIKMSNDLMLGKRARHEEKAIAKHYRGELARMQELRSQGVTGRIEFKDWTEVL